MANLWPDDHVGGSS